MAKTQNRVLAWVLSLALALTLLPVNALAEGDTELEHLPGCGYLCDHLDHNANCGYVAEVAEVPCTHEHDESCGENEATCNHTHDGTCGYVAAVEGVSCNHDCAAEGCVWGCAEGCPIAQANAVIKMIADLPEVEGLTDMDDESFSEAAAAIGEASNAYDALTTDQQALVTNSEKLKDLKNLLDILTAEVEPIDGITSEPEPLDDEPEVTVTMDNVLMKLNKTTRIYFEVTPGYEDKISFEAENDSKLLVSSPDKPDSFTAITIQNACEVGETLTINAIYEGKIVGSCSVLVISSTSKRINYTSEDGSNPKFYFATPTTVNANWVTEETDSWSDIVWEWDSKNSDAVGVDVDPDDDSKATITVYQQTSSSVSVSATPFVTVGGVTYKYPYMSNNGEDKSVSCFNEPIGYTYWSIDEGESTTLTFNLPAEFQNSAVVTWNSNYPELLSTNETSYQVTLTAQPNVPSGSEYVDVKLTAETTVDGHTYKGYTVITVYPTETVSDKAIQVGTLDALNEQLKDLEETDRNISITDTIELPASTELVIPENVTIYRGRGLKGALFNVTGTNVTITGGNNVVIDGLDRGADAALITVAKDGELSISDITLRNSLNTDDGDDGEGGKGGAISVNNGTLICENVTFEGNEVHGGSTGSIDYTGGGAIYASESDITVTDCTFKDNTAIFGQGGAIYADQGTTGTIENNTITDCSAAHTADAKSHGGGIYCRLADDMEITGNNISGCAAQYGGGIAIIVSDDDKCGTITLADNTINGNTAYERGGGLYLVQNSPGTIKLQSGTISNNSAKWGGGIDYTVHSMETLTLTNVLITGNSAVRGGGVWACPTSETESYSTLGGAIYDNTASGKTEVNPISASGDDIRYEGKDAKTHGEDALISGGDQAAEDPTDPTKTPIWFSDTTTMTVTSRALGGGLMRWYRDEQDDRYGVGDSEADPKLYTNTNQSFSLHGELSADHQELAKEEARLIIRDNKAESRGGGIASNSPIQLGIEGADKTVTVTKTWVGEGGHPDSVTIDLYRVDADDNEVLLDSGVTLNEDNGWSVTFTDLPAYYLDENGGKQDYTYTVKETPVPGWKSTMSTTVVGQTTVITLTNTADVAALSISKAVTGNETTQEFTFRVKLTQADGTTPLTGTYYYTGSTEGQKSITLDPNGEATVSLRHGQTISINLIPVGTLYTVTEVPVEGYTPSYTGSDANAVYSNRNEGQIVSGSGGVVSYTNVYNAPVTTNTVTVYYRDLLTGNEIDDSYTYVFIGETGKTYDVADRDQIPIPGYTYVRTDGAPLTGTLDSDKVIIVYYTSNDAAPDLAVTKELTEVNGRTYTGGRVDTGDDLTYTITVTNTGETVLENINVTDTLPSGLRLVSDDTDWTIDSLAPRASRTFTITATVRASAEGELLNNRVTAQCGDLTVMDNETVRVDEDYTPTPTPDPDPDRPSRPDPDRPGDGDDTTDIADEEVPLAELPGLNKEDHFAYIIGYEDGTVRPEGYITRAEVATIFFRLMTDEYRETYWATSNLFTDVAQTNWYNNGVSTTANVGWIAGYPDGSYRPNNNITRAEFATIAARFLSGDYNGENMFTDIDGHWAADYINRAAAIGWITGYAGQFRPDDYITRAEAVTLINRMLDRAPDADHMLENMIRWPDNPETAWYYEAIQEATNSHDYDRETIIDFETWTVLLENRDWAALEELWAKAADATGGEVADNLTPNVPGDDN